MREGGDVALFGVGMMVYESLVAADMLAEKGISAGVINLRSIKPIDIETIINQAEKTGAVVVSEDHNRFGGAGGAVAEVLALYRPTALEQAALDDVFAESGTYDELLDKYGLTARHIVEKALTAIKRGEKRNA